MNPMVQASIVTAIRLALSFGLAGKLVFGTPSDAEIDKYVGAAILIVTGVWSWYEKFKKQQSMVTMGEAANMSESTAQARAADPLIPTPSVTTPKDEVPKV